MKQSNHKLTEKSNLEAESTFLINRIQVIEEDIRLGRSKPYHQEMLAETQLELKEKQHNLTALSASATEFNVPIAFLASVKYDIQTLIGLLDQDSPNRQLLHTLSARFISNLHIQRETERLHLTVQFKYDEKVVYEKTLVAEWR
jgi:hypothetical protein